MTFSNAGGIPRNLQNEFESFYYNPDEPNPQNYSLTELEQLTEIKS